MVKALPSGTQSSADSVAQAYQQARAVIARVKSVEMDRLHRQIRIEEQQPTLQRDMRILLKQVTTTAQLGPDCRNVGLASLLSASLFDTHPTPLWTAATSHRSTWTNG